MDTERHATKIKKMIAQQIRKDSTGTATYRPSTQVDVDRLAAKANVAARTAKGAGVSRKKR